MSFHYLDMERYERIEHFRYFLSMPYPYVGVTVDTDVTDTVSLCKARGYSFYLTFLHAAAKAADRVPELRRRIRDGVIIEYDACPTSHTELCANGTYCYCTLRHDQPFEEYIAYAETERRRRRESGSLREDADVESMYFISTLPWLHYSALIQPAAGGEESNPRITWGAFAPNAEGRLQMPVTLLVHHALADGSHIAKFYDALRAELAAIAARYDAS